ncbi:MAG: polysaccharide lyase [Lentisphaerales bacterium]|nr:polysaccharide lyase [Lentisphaerales bacterium]
MNNKLTTGLAVLLMLLNFSRIQAEVPNQFEKETVKLSSSTDKKIHYNWSPQKEVLPSTNLIDFQFGLVASSAKKCGFSIDEQNRFKGHAVYKFWAGPKANRVELTECFSLPKDVAHLSADKLNELSEIKDVYGLVSCGDYGDTIFYSWYTKFPEPLTQESKGIFAQWHGRPDRTAVRKPDGLREHLSIKRFLELSSQLKWKGMNDKKGGVRGFDKDSGEELNYTVDGPAGGPIGAFSINNGYIQLFVRNGPRVISTNSRPKIKPSPKQPAMALEDGRSGALVFHEKIDTLPINQWLHFRVEIKFSDYSAKENKAISKGHVKLWINDEQKADWQGDVGKNDFLGPYFKFGIYKPGSNGFKVDHCGYKRRLIKKGSRTESTIHKYIQSK